MFFSCEKGILSSVLATHFFRGIKTSIYVAEAKCAAFGEKLQECNDRVNSRSQTLETCTEELFDFLHCVDHCAAKDIFKQLK